MKLLAATLALAPLAAAHFKLNYPPSFGFDEDKEPTQPCGGFTSDKATNTTIQSGGFPMAFELGHPEGEYQIRASLQTSAPYNWTSISPVVKQTGGGFFCLPSLTAPDMFTGKTGVIQVAVSTVDGVLFQCALVNFAQGKNSSVNQDSCKNASGVSASTEPQSTLTNLPAATSGSSSGGSGSSSSSGGVGPRETGGAFAAGVVGLVGLAALL